MNGLGEAINTLIWLAFIGVLAIVISSFYGIYKLITWLF